MLTVINIITYTYVLIGLATNNKITILINAALERGLINIFLSIFTYLTINYIKWYLVAFQKCGGNLGIPFFLKCVDQPLFFVDKFIVFFNFLYSKMAHVELLPEGVSILVKKWLYGVPNLVCVKQFTWGCLCSYRGMTLRSTKLDPRSVWSQTQVNSSSV